MVFDPKKFAGAFKGAPKKKFGNEEEDNGFKKPAFGDKPAFGGGDKPAFGEEDDMKKPAFGEDEEKEDGEDEEKEEEPLEKSDHKIIADVLDLFDKLTPLVEKLRDIKK